MEIIHDWKNHCHFPGLFVKGLRYEKYASSKAYSLTWVRLSGDVIFEVFLSKTIVFCDVYTLISVQTQIKNVYRNVISAETEIRL